MLRNAPDSRSHGITAHCEKIVGHDITYFHIKNSSHLTLKCLLHEALSQGEMSVSTKKTTKTITSASNKFKTSCSEGETSSKVKKNSNGKNLPVILLHNVLRLPFQGGVLVTSEELRAAFDFLDIDQTGRVTLGNLKSRLGPFFPEYTSKDFRFLMNSKRELTADDLTDMLMDNEITNFDPVFEAFKVFRLYLSRRTTF